MSYYNNWIELFQNHDIEAVHWSKIGEHRAKDHVIMEWARDKQYVIFTNDLDFGTLLALTQATAPSVIQMRTQNVLPEHLGHIVISILKEYDSNLMTGALIVVDDRVNRVRILPLS